MEDEMRRIYLIGSLRNSAVPALARALRTEGHEVYDDWHAAGPWADDHWKYYERVDRGHSFKEALTGWAATHIFQNDKLHLNQADTGVLLLPAGVSGHLELGYLAGQGKPVFILLHTPSPDRWDVMYRLATKVCVIQEELFLALRRLAIP